jgi:hypothetical protein
VDVHDDWEALTYAEEVLQSLDPQAVLLTQTDEQTFSLWYARDVLGLRPDVLVLDVRLLLWSWYGNNLRRLSPELPWPDSPPITVEQAVALTHPRPVYFADPQSGFPTIPQGNVYALDRTRAAVPSAFSPP